MATGAGESFHVSMTDDGNSERLQSTLDSCEIVPVNGRCNLLSPPVYR